MGSRQRLSRRQTTSPSRGRTKGTVRKATALWEYLRRGFMPGSVLQEICHGRRTIRKDNARLSFASSEKWGQSGLVFYLVGVNKHGVCASLDTRDGERRPVCTWRTALWTAGRSRCARSIIHGANLTICFGDLDSIRICHHPAGRERGVQ
jgi:hypothetical protein